MIMTDLCNVQLVAPVIEQDKKNNYTSYSDGSAKLHRYTGVNQA